MEATQGTTHDDQDASAVGPMHRTQVANLGPDRPPYLPADTMSTNTAMTPACCDAIGCTSAIADQQLC